MIYAFVTEFIDGTVDTPLYVEHNNPLATEHSPHMAHYMWFNELHVDCLVKFSKNAPHLSEYNHITLNTENVKSIKVYNAQKTPTEHNILGSFACSAFPCWTS